jgi:superfamily II DNA or RNA helicase
MKPAIASKLLQSLENSLPPSILIRGKKIFTATPDAISIVTETDNDRMILEVQGTDVIPYDVHIHIKKIQRNPKFELFCSCPFFNSYGIVTGCKHIYASALYLNSISVEPPVPVQETWSHTLNQLLRKAENIEPLATKAISKKKRESKFVLKLKPARYPGDRMTFRMATLIDPDFGRIKSFKNAHIGQKNWAEDDQLWADRILSYYALNARSYYGIQYTDFELPTAWVSSFLPQLLEEERIWVNPAENEESNSIPLQNQISPPCTIAFKGYMGGDSLLFAVEAHREDQPFPITLNEELYADGLFRKGNALYRIEPAEHAEWLNAQSLVSELKIPLVAVPDAIDKLYHHPLFPTLDLPEDFRYTTIRTDLIPELRITNQSEARQGTVLELFWQYGPVTLAYDSGQNPVPSQMDKRLYPRDPTAEAKALDLLTNHGAKPITSSYYHPHTHTWSLPKAGLSPLITDAISAGWSVQLENKHLKTSQGFSFEIQGSSIDWFDVHASVEFGEEQARLPALLAALKNKQDYIQLSNGNLGLIPDSLRRQVELLQKLGKANPKGDAVRFKGAQALMLDLMMENLPDVSWDEKGTKLRNRLRNIQKPIARKAPHGFKGTLRPYQEEGLGWMTYLQKIGIQGCLADDMGLGKTVQVLAMLEARRQDKAPPSILVMPKSLVHNWIHEAKKFTPNLTVAALVGSDRPKSIDDLPPADIYLTTYSLLQRDIIWLKKKSFDYAILDESQAIKNAKTKSAKSCKLLGATHRLTMTGTPVENRLDDLWSQLDFLNPGLLKGAVGGKKTLEDDQMQLLARATRPFLLRRTKEQVVKDLPEKVEETLYCELPPAHAKKYNELKLYYQQQLNQKIQQKGLKRSKIIVLEALLRLRQAACHPGLINPDERNHSSGKLELLKDMLSDIVPTGHKALIFSQFTSFLSIAEDLLKQEGYPYAYLDGKSKDRPEQIQKFQESTDCNLFLISLKAGGVGLNLTAADYVFLLDPWWNPAIEAQAIDRAHRIGQQRNVFAYRIVAENTIEDKILQLQSQKKELADAILSEENSLLSSLTMDDLNFLLG